MYFSWHENSVFYLRSKPLETSHVITFQALEAARFGEQVGLTAYSSAFS
jgi:hypothetical protein